MKTVIYKIINTVNNKIYVGSALNFNLRKNSHLGYLRKNTHINKHLQSAYNKHGEDSFIFEVIEDCNKEDLLKREQFYIDTLNPEYNICKIAGSKLGWKTPQITKDRISKANKGKIITQETRDKISKKLKSYGYKVIHSEETRRKISEKTKGKVHIRTLEVLWKKRKPVNIVDEKGNILRKYISLKDASNDLNINVCAIHRVANGERNNTHNVIFKYNG